VYTREVSGIIPAQLYRRVTMPAWVWNYRPFSGFASWLYGIDALGAKLFAALFLTLIVSGFISVFYTYTYRRIGSKRYRKLNAAPPRRKSKRYKR
jgi:hypothetical protein